MLNAVRRGPASIARSFLLPSSSSRCIKSITGSNLLPRPSRISSKPSIRALSTTPRWNQRLANRELEEEVDDELGDPQQQSDSRIHDAPHHGPVTKFQDLATKKMVCETVVDTITKTMGLETMTQVQSLTINETLKGSDIIAQARTGTGKTLAFLIPVLQNIISNDPTLEKRSYGRSSSTDIRAIIVSPTRELAEQIAVEARKVTADTGVIVQTAVGGSSKQQGLRQIKNQGCHILVGTPGRLNDLLSDPYSSVRAPNLSAFVLDEADRLLDAGFAPEIEAIQSRLPNRRDVDRQTLLFSATVPEEVMHIVRRTTKPGCKFVRTVQAGEQETDVKVPQKVVRVSGFENLLPALVELSKRELTRTDGLPFKAIVYFAATAEVRLAAETLRNLKDTRASGHQMQNPLYPARIIEIHGKLSQYQRTDAADAFRRAKHGIMLSSDVTARGMDFPNVTHVIQLGLPPSREAYIHRLGRTARGDKTGEGWIFLTKAEDGEARYRLSKLPLVSDTSLETAKVDMSQDATLTAPAAAILTQVIEASKKVALFDKSAAYLAGLGTNAFIRNKQDLLDSMNRRVLYCWGMETPPSIPRGLAAKLGFSGLRGVNLSSGSRPMDDTGRSDPRSDGYGRGRSPQGGYAIPRGSSYNPYNNGRRGEGRGHSRTPESGGSGFRSGGDRSGGFRSGGERSGGFRSGGDRSGDFGRSGSRSRDYDRF